MTAEQFIQLIRARAAVINRMARDTLPVLAGNIAKRHIDSSFRQVEMSEAMRLRLQESDYIFSGMKAFHELSEAFPSLLDENGVRKPFERFLKDVRKVDETYNRNYLAAEFNFAHASAAMAARWEVFMKDGDQYNLQYRTARDSRVRPEHAALDGVTLPPSDPFWETYYPPNGWNCRCSAVQVRRTKYPETSHEEAMKRGEEATARDKRGIFRFNPGRQRKTFPDYNPYTISRCRDCDVAKGKLNAAKTYIPDNEMCQACKLVRSCEKNREEVIKCGKGTIRISHLVNRSDSDFQNLMQVAQSFAKEGSVVRLTPKMTRPSKFDYECVYGDLIGTKFEGKCPDLNIDGMWYEHEGFNTNNPKRAFSNMMAHGLKQSNRIIIEHPGLSDRYMKRSIYNRINLGEDIEEVWLRESDGTRFLLYKKT